MKRLTTLLLCFLTLHVAFGQELEAYHNTVEGGYNFWVYTPPEKVMQQNKLQPLVIFLHGHSLCGKNLDKVRRYGPLHAIQMGREINAIVLAPQNSGGAWKPEKIFKDLEFVKNNYPIDTNRIYVFGMSLGGYGTIDFVSAYPDHIAAAIAMCGGGNPKSYCGLNEVPLWIMHGTADRDVPVSQSQKVISQMERCGDTPRLLFTKLPGVTHGGLAKAFYISMPYEWLLSHRLDTPDRPVTKGYEITPSDLKNAYSDLHRNVPPLKVVQHNQKASTANKESVVDVTSTGAEYYTIKKGDTLSKIAVRHHTTVAKLCKLNNLKSTSIIHDGKRIRIK